jgi:hypothetical protein
MRYAGTGSYMQMAFPEEYLKAVRNAITAPDFETKQKWTQEAIKLMIDKYCLQIMIFFPPEFAVSQKYLHDHGVYETPNTIAWTPEDAWLEK